MSDRPSLKKVRVCVRHGSVELDRGSALCQMIVFAMGDFALKAMTCRFRWFYLPERSSE